jgi:MarR family transcriptional regulator, lower aerobic nicotinate degradation pathway regulator
VLLVKAAEKTSQAFSDRLTALDIQPKHYGILFWLVNEGSLSQVELGQHMGIDRAPMVQLIDHLEQQKLVERTSHPGDRRINRIMLTDKGREIWTQATQLAKEAETEVLATLSPQECEQLNYLLNRLLR